MLESDEPFMIQRSTFDTCFASPLPRPTPQPALEEESHAEAAQGAEAAEDRGRRTEDGEEGLTTETPAFAQPTAGRLEKTEARTE